MQTLGNGTAVVCQIIGHIYLASSQTKPIAGTTWLRMPLFLLDPSGMCAGDLGHYRHNELLMSVRYDFLKISPPLESLLSSQKGFSRIP